MLPRPLALSIVVIMLVIEMVNFGAQFVLDGYHSDPLVHGLFGLIVGGAMALSRRDSSEDQSLGGWMRRIAKPGDDE